MKKAIKLAILATLTMLLLACLTACAGTKTVQLEPYISARFSGTDGNGTAVFDFDYSSFEYEIMSEWKDGEQMKNLAALTEVEFTLNLEQATAEGLHNGDKVTATMTYDKELAKKAGYAFSDTSRTFTVEGLIEPIEIDPFDERVFGEGKTVSFTLEGVSPDVYFDLRNGAGLDDPLYNVTYHLDPTIGMFDSFKNGDVIPVTAQLSAYAAAEGYVLTRTEITIPVEGFDAYVTGADQLSAEALQEVANRALLERQNISHVKIYDGTNDMIRTELPENIHVGDTAYLAVPKEGAWEWGYTPILLVPVYETMVSPDYYDMATGTEMEKRWENIVSYFTFTEPVLHDDNTFSYNTNAVGVYGAYPDAATAEELFLSDFEELYDRVEIPMP